MRFSKNAEKRKGAAAAVLCFVAAIAIAGAYTFKDYKESKSEKELAKVEEINIAEEERILDEAVDGEIVSNESTQNQENEQETLKEKDDVTGSEDSSNEADNADNLSVFTEADYVENVSASNTASAYFAEDSLILWPVSGAVLMDYSMDKTVYFKTLDQYKYNPAMIIAGAQGDQVIAGVSGIVKSIDESAQTGLTVNVDFGNGYEAFYGQLISLEVKTGDYVDATTTLGYVAEPTKYYSSEGSNLYFEMRKDGQPVDPKLYLTEYVE